MNNFYKLPTLPYEYNGLEPYIDSETMQIHYNKHHAAYVKNLNEAIGKHSVFFEKSPEDLLMNLNSIPDDIKIAVRNNAGGHVNHSMFWQIMASPSEALAKEGAIGGGEPLGILAQEIQKYFGSFSEFQNKFNEAGLKRFGSGWVWLIKTKDGKLDVVSTANQDNPMTDGHSPIMGNDVWEHAYYLKYKNMRADYLKSWWNLVNWQEIENRFKNS